MDAREIISVLIELVSGAVCANIVGNTFFDQPGLGVLGRSLAGIVGAGLGGKLLVLMLGGRGAHSGIVLSSILVPLVGGSLGGAIVMLLVGFSRRQSA
jgi:hypothetical protein